MACGTPATPTRFERLEPTRTGIAFRNDLPERADFNILNYLYYYNGGGVAVGDIDNDGLQDLYFSSNVGPNRLYRNLGDYRFEDITDRAGVAGPPGWKTGVTMADVNGDGFVDIYASAVRYLTMAGRNALYLNNGDGTFTDRTEALGLSYAGYSTQAAFLDYDADGDLDLYLLVHSTHNERSISPVDRARADAPGKDRFYRNDGERFTDVTDAVGLVDGVAGFGLGVVVTDENGDGCPDLYIANDFQENDFLYRNTCQGRFTEVITSATRHTSRFSMGVDAADVNNDGWPDLFVTDMLPEREEVLKTSASSESPNLFDLRLRAGYHPQYARNTLQLNRGNGRYSEIGYLAGVHASDWSWAPLFADLDNDGRKDLFITNGILRRPNDLDYINYISAQDVQAMLARGITDSVLTVLTRLPSVPLPNHAFRNEGGYRFRDMASAWGLGREGFSNGAAYVDLTNSGRLDLVVNEVNAPASVYRNRGADSASERWVRVDLRGRGRNTAGFGARVSVSAGGTTQWREQFPTRGFQSSVDPRLHFGVGRATRAESVVVTWPDGRREVRRDVAMNQVLRFFQDSAAMPASGPAPQGAAPRFVEVASERAAAVRHLEEPFQDWNREPLMPRLLSTEGPALAVGDLNGDGTDDLFVGGGKWQAGAVLLQGRDGRFTATDQPALRADSLSEDVDAVLLDADGDRDLDLFVVSGGNEFFGDAEPLRDRLYLNDGRGRLSRSPFPIPGLHNGGAVAAADYDGDGDVDLAVVNRVVARAYGRTPPSQLLRNQGGGRFEDVTAEVAPGLLAGGMLASVAWVDTDADGRLDLVAAGEWTPLRVYRQRAGRFVDETTAAGLDSTHGWWNVVRVADVNGDGRPDLVAGNLGLNSYLRASPAEPAELFVNDYFATGSLKQILTFYKGGVSYPLVGRDELVRLMPPLRSRYPTYRDFGASTVRDILPPAEYAKSDVLRAQTFASVVAINRGGRFEVQALPDEAQFSPTYAVVPDDYDGDGRLDLLVAGNLAGVPPVIGRHDAGQGLMLRGDGQGGWAPMDMSVSGLLIQADARRAQLVRDARGGRMVAVTSSGGVLQLWRVRE